MVKLVVLISGKRKSGKDYCCKALKKALEPLKVSIHGVSHSLKKIYANNHGELFLLSKCQPLSGGHPGAVGVGCRTGLVAILGIRGPYFQGYND
ncbi:hypothetical protein Y032_0368g64 [Ancylostoma ceylanicum]|uniref:Phosphomevalonate kinase n=1 Tax=Ancylostoma ceylanicum TaxID=53326 RepID=A0A016RVF2_9BILA|nr:hypothetical protein Y032_0368g64 [Ancylostoma ceylanicum]